MKLPIDELVVANVAYTFQISIAFGMGYECQLETEFVLKTRLYPPDKQPEAIKLVIEQMEAMAPRYAEALATQGK